MPCKFVLRTVPDVDAGVELADVINVQGCSSSTAAHCPNVYDVLCRMSISLKVLTSTLSKMFRPFSTPLVQELSTGLYCGRPVTLAGSASLPAGPGLLQEELRASANAVLKPQHLPMHMGYKRKLMRSARALAAVHAATAEAGAAQKPSLNEAPALTQSCADVQRASSSITADVAAASATEMQNTADGCGAVPTVSPDGKVRTEKAAGNTGGRGVPVTVEATISDQHSKPSSSRGLETSESRLQEQLEQNAYSLEFTDAKVEEQYRVFSNVQQLQVSPP